jgi:NAD(P)H-quinone oxidoreductase subunit 4
MLSLLLWLPVIGAVLVGCYPGNLEYSRLRQITITVTVIIFAISLYLLNQFNLSSSGM